MASVEEFRKRRQNRLDVAAYKARQKQRQDAAEFKEGDHPRAKNGQFAKKGEGGGGEGASEKKKENSEKTSQKGLTKLQKSSKVKSQGGNKTADMKADETKAREKVTWVSEGKKNTYSDFKWEALDMDKVAKETSANMTDIRRASYAAKDFCDEQKAREPEITKNIVNAVADLGGKMFGLDFRMKQPTSLCRKVIQDAKEDGVSFEKAISKMADGCRYTAIFDDDSFVDNYYKTKQALEAKGYKEMRCKNFWKQFRDGESDQKAVQCVYADKAGKLFELQFHTNDSQGIKEVNHPLYEEWRQTGTTVNRKAELSARMKNIGNMVNDPKGVFDIPEHNELKKG